MPKNKLKGTRPEKMSSSGSLADNGSDQPQKRLSVRKTYKLFIGGKFPRTESGRYYKVKLDNRQKANVCQASRKDFRDAVVSARSAFGSWSGSSAYNRGQILYRIAEMLEGRKTQFRDELVQQGLEGRTAEQEVGLSIDRLIYYAGWSDKYQQIFSSVNPVSSSHFNFSLCEPTGVVAIISPENPSLLGLISLLASTVVGGNTCIALASEKMPFCAISLAEVLHSSDVPAGVVNILTGFSEELDGHFATHMDVNALIYARNNAKTLKSLQQKSAENLKRLIVKHDLDWDDEGAQSPYFILDTQEIKTTWHPVGL